MTIIFRHHEKLEINRVDYCGAIRLTELLEHARYRTTVAHWLNHDHINVVARGAHAPDVTKAALDALYLQHRELFETEKLLIRRRSAWICQSPPVLDILKYWVGARGAKKSGHTDVRLFDTFEEAGQWLVLNHEEIAIAASGEGFFEVARFDAPAPAALTR